MACNKKIAQDIVNDCDRLPIAGIEAIATVFNRADIDTVTYDVANANLITAITLASGTQAYTIQGYKRGNQAGHDTVVAENLPDTYTQFFSFEAWELDSDTLNAIDNMEDIVIIVENLNKGNSGDGAFEVYGIETGLYKSSDARRSNDNKGIRTLELTSRAGEEASVSRHNFFDTDYATTKAAVVALLTPVP